MGLGSSHDGQTEAVSPREPPNPASVLLGDFASNHRTSALRLVAGYASCSLYRRPALGGIREDLWLFNFLVFETREHDKIKGVPLLIVWPCPPISACPNSLLRSRAFTQVRPMSVSVSLSVQQSANFPDYLVYPFGIFFVGGLATQCFPSFVAWFVHTYPPIDLFTRKQGLNGKSSSIQLISCDRRLGAACADSYNLSTSR